MAVRASTHNNGCHTLPKEGEAPDVERSVRGPKLRSLSWHMFWFKNSVYFYGLRPELNVDNKNVLSKAIKK
jgi:hypothetical protein